MRIVKFSCREICTSNLVLVSVEYCMSWLLRLSKQKNAQFYFYHTAHTAIGLLVWTYFNFLLLRTKEDFFEAVPIIFLSHGFTYLGLIIGFIAGAVILSKMGYRNNFKLTFLFYFFAILIVLFNLEKVQEIYVVVSLLKGLADGIFWLSANTYTLKEYHGLQRSKALGILFAELYLIQIIIPIFAGGLITAYSYSFLFISGMVVVAIIGLWPFSENLVPENHFDWNEIVGMIKRKGFKSIGFVNYLGQLIDNQRTLIMLVLPMLLIGNELGVGMFMSFVALVAAIISFVHRNDDDRHQLNNGYLGGIIAGASTIMLAVVWTLPALIIRDILAKLGFALWTPVKMNLENQVNELFLRDFLNESATEALIYREVMFSLARFTNMILFVMIFYVFRLEPEPIMRMLLLISAVREGFIIFGNATIKKYLQVSPANLASA